MGRRNRRRTEPGRTSTGRVLPERVEDAPGAGAWLVRTVAGRQESRGAPYRCPGCDQEIASGSPHVVAWPEDGLPGTAGPDARRHWHSTCWAARATRRPRVRRPPRTR